MTIVLMHLLAAYAVLAGPWLGRMMYQRVRRQIAAGVLDAKVRFYRQLVVEQIITTSLVLFLWRSGRIPAVSLGLVAPRSWDWSLAGLAAVVGALVWSSLQLRPKAEKLRQKVQDSVGALIPDSHSERSWWPVVSVGAGVSEELVFRGFLLYYLSLYLPHLNGAERMLLVSLSFGLAHIYQGWKGAVGTGFLGLILGGLYLLTGSLLLPVVIHAVVDARVLLMFPPNASPRLAAQGNA
jgi:membrane protease YdiL (CAAX protease family)